MQRGARKIKASTLEVIALRGIEANRQLNVSYLEEIISIIKLRQKNKYRVVELLA